MAPAGSFTGATDVLGNNVYTMTPGATSPLVNVTRSGYYAAAYGQDTWNITKKLTANYGVRFDAYRQQENLDSSIGNNTSSLVDLAELSPRMNLAYKLAQNTVLRTSYDRLFTEPPLAQGSIIGQSILPQVTDQYEVSLERQITPRQVAKLSYYTKLDKNQIDVGILIPYTQVGAYSAVNFQEGHIKGLEFSYDLLPEHDNHGWSAYMAYTNSLAKPTGIDNTGAPVPDYNDHDQLNTVSTGAAYAWHSGLTAATDVYYGSGTTTSIVENIQGTNVLNNGARTPHTQVNCSLSTNPKVPGRVGFALSVDNVFNSLALINFNSGFTGTRFQMGRCVMLSSFLHY